MAHVLITGMTASQASPGSLKRFRGFGGQIVDVLAQSGHTGVIAPSAGNLDQYDTILVGLAPILSLGANNAYSALHLIDDLTRQNDPRLRFFVDAPTPAHITASLTSINNNPDRLTKALFQKRPGYPQTDAEVSRLISAVAWLTDNPWPATLAPQLPWGSEWDRALPLADSTAISLNLDSSRLIDFIPNLRERVEVWGTDNLKSKWVIKNLQNLTLNAVDIKPTRLATDAQVSTRMALLTGTLLAPQRDGETWWSPRYLDSLAVGTPVATEWRDSQVISPSWGVLPATIEDMSMIERSDLALEQMTSYLSSIPSINEASVKLADALGIS